MKPTHWAALLLTALVLAMASCASSTSATPIPTVALDSTRSSEITNVLASAQVVPAQEARLSFAISGLIKEVAVEEGITVEAGQILATLSSPDLEYGVLQAEDAVRKAEFDYDYWKLPRRVGFQVVERGPVAAQDLEVTRRTLDTAHAELSQTELFAPFEATVISVEAQTGEYVRPGQVVIVLARLDSLQIKTIDLSELNVATVELGQPASIYVEALDKEFPGEVTAISPISDTIGGDVVYTVTIHLNEQPADLLWGMSAEVEIQLEQ